MIVDPFPPLGGEWIYPPSSDWRNLHRRINTSGTADSSSSRRRLIWYMYDKSRMITRQRAVLHIYRAFKRCRRYLYIYIWQAGSILLSFSTNILGWHTDSPPVSSTIYIVYIYRYSAMMELFFYIKAHSSLTHLSPFNVHDNLLSFISKSANNTTWLTLGNGNSPSSSLFP